MCSQEVDTQLKISLPFPVPEIIVQQALHVGHCRVFQAVSSGHGHLVFLREPEIQICLLVFRKQVLHLSRFCTGLCKFEAESNSPVIETFQVCFLQCFLIAKVLFFQNYLQCIFLNPLQICDVFQGQAAVPDLTRLFKYGSNIENIDCNQVLMRYAKLHQFVEESHSCIRALN